MTSVGTSTIASAGIQGRVVPLRTLSVKTGVAVVGVGQEDRHDDALVPVAPA